LGKQGIDAIARLLLWRSGHRVHAISLDGFRANRRAAGRAAHPASVP
jgi:hypothetical protein